MLLVTYVTRSRNQVKAIVHPTFRRADRAGRPHRRADESAATSSSRVSERVRLHPEAPHLQALPCVLVSVACGRDFSPPRTSRILVMGSTSPNGVSRKIRPGAR